MLKKRAVIVGINEYKDKEKIPALTGAVNDARELHDILTGPAGGFEIGTDHFLTDDRADSVSVRKAISDLLWQTKPCDMALFHFSGHGFVDGYRNHYIAPHDMLRDEPLVHGINMADLRRWARSAVHQTVVMILDCCHSGIPSDERGMIDNPRESLELMLNPKDEEQAGEGKYFIASCEGDKKAREMVTCQHSADDPQHAHGAFTYYLIQGLSGRGATDPSGKITLNKLVEYVESQIAIAGKQKPICDFRGTSRMSLVEIARSPEVFIRYIADELQSIKNLCSQAGSPTNLVDAMKRYHLLTLDAKDNAEVQALRPQVCSEWHNLRSTILKFTFEKQSELDRELTVPTCTRIMSLAQLKEPQKIAELDHPTMNLLVMLGKAAKGDMPFDLFVDVCKASWAAPYLASTGPSPASTGPLPASTGPSPASTGPSPASTGPSPASTGPG